ncbi:MAG: DHHW family protein [Oscillospiraceae bacterium]
MDKLFFKIIFPLWLGLIIINLAMPKQSFSESENRYLSSFPKLSVETLMNGDFMEGVDSYLNDHFAGRDNWITAQSFMEYSIGKRESNGVFLCKDALMSDLAPPNEDIVTGNINGIKAFMEKYHLPSYLMLVPSASAIQSEKLPHFAQVWDQKAFIEKVFSQLEGQVTPVPLYDTLRAHKDEYIYYRTDHHWTTHGAFLAYQQLSSTMKLPTSEVVDFSTNIISDDFIGTLSSKSGVYTITPDSMNAYQTDMIEKFLVSNGKQVTERPSVYFDEFLSKKDKYAYYLGSNEPLVTIKTKSTSGKRLLIFKDSYAHSFAPFLANDYSEIALVDLRYINTDIDDVLDVSSYDDALFLFSTDVFAQQGLLKKLK